MRLASNIFRLCTQNCLYYKRDKSTNILLQLKGLGNGCFLSTKAYLLTQQQHSRRKSCYQVFTQD